MGETRVVKIYALVDPRDGEVRYIGATLTGLNTRLAGHRSTALSNGYGCNGPKSAWLQELYYGGFEPEIRTLREVSAEERVEAEREAIAEHLAKGAHLFNDLDKVGRWRFPQVEQKPTRLVTAEVSAATYERLRFGCTHSSYMDRFAGELIEEALRRRREDKAAAKRANEQET